jgi:hypothetical protein
MVASLVAWAVASKLGIALQLGVGKSMGLLYREMGVFSGTFPCPKDILNGYSWLDKRN